MGKKKRRIFVYAGSLIQPLFRYVTHAEFRFSMKDSKGGALAENLYHLARSTKKQYQAPDAVFKMMTHKKPNSEAYVKFITGWETTYDLKDANLEFIMKNMKYYNYVIEEIRNDQDMDDEPEDEDRVL